ncbi:hypothetical protein [Photobacterium satsumensis]|uniref:hypothetical protein n=1 Tax=Photobacterium satsumensis TaxID=2910239 RepID=UPI003D106932
MHTAPYYAVQLTNGIDLAKYSFSIHGENHQGKVLIHRTIPRSKVLSTFAYIPPAIVVMEACGTSHYWAREIAKLGHITKMISTMPWLSASLSPEQQAILQLHRDIYISR